MRNRFLTLTLSLIFLLSSCTANNGSDGVTEQLEIATTPSPAITQAPIPTETPTPQYHFSIEDIPAYSGQPYTTLNSNIPFFTDGELITEPFEKYSPLDSLGRCGVAYANICKELMPTEERQGIGQVKPAGWHTVRYEVVGKGSAGFLYNRCHLIAYELAAENANERNLITGTRYMNMQGMRYFEDSVADYVKATNNHVIYRVTPIYNGDNLLCDGLQIEAKSVEDNGAGICFNAFCYNVQPGVIIEYATGESRLDETDIPSAETQAEAPPNINNEVTTATYILNTNTKKFHYPNCSSVSDMSEKNKREFTGSRDEVINQGYVPCKRCLP